GAAEALVGRASRARPSNEESAPEDSAGRVNATEIVPLLVELLTDSPSEELRSAVASALMRHRGGGGVQVALQQAARQDPSPQVRAQIAFLFRRAGVPLPGPIQAQR